MFKIFIADELSPKTVEFLQAQKDCEVEVETGLSEAELVKKIPEFDALIVRSATTVTPKIIAAGKKLKIVGRAGAGTDNIDKKAATDAGVLVVNAPTGNLTSVAELVFGQTLAAFRRLPEANTSTKAGEWKKKELGKIGRELDGKTLGIVGLGKIGQLVAERAQGFNLKVLAFDPVVTPEIADSVGAELVELEELLKNSDVITLHVPLIPQTKNLIAKKQFELMKADAMLLNLARGGVVDEKALLEWLKEKPQALAALDTFVEEPVDKKNPLLALSNFFVTPHLGASTIEAQEKVGLQLADQVVRALRGEVVEYIVNLPAREGGSLKDQKVWNELTEKMSRLAAQVLGSAKLKKATLKIAGEISEADTKMPEVSATKGLLETMTDATNVNFTNALDLSEKKGLKLIIKKEKHCENYKSQICLELTAEKATVKVCGTLVEGEPRITLIQDFKVNFRPTEHLLLTQHHDQPGIIGRVGTLLGENSINIANMDLGRNKVGGEALMILDVDDVIPEQLVDELKSWDDFEEVVCVDF
ncbi:MAG: phosphoglycerate dehydrogenase [Candidatus Peribacteraceae bacterium]|nr:phosphoglycerate dehydrogenase [Candidatus Peribacteraceae bacterium]